MTRYQLDTIEFDEDDALFNIYFSWAMGTHSSKYSYLPRDPFEFDKFKRNIFLLQ